MIRNKIFCTLLVLLSVAGVQAQEVLPAITVKDFSGKIIVSWLNEYKVQVTNISIQRSYDSTKNYTTIGSVLNPQNLENGYADNTAPYNKMYYRLFISFEGGAYAFSKIVRPVKVLPPPGSENTLRDESRLHAWQAKPAADTILIPETIPVQAEQPTPDTGIHITIPSNLPRLHLPSKKDSIALIKGPEIIPYPSARIFSNRDNNVVIYLKDAPVKKYLVKFYDETHVFLFELNKLKEEYLIVEKVNFVHAGWFHFEIFENGKLIEKNKFFIGRDTKNNNGK